MGWGDIFFFAYKAFWFAVIATGGFVGLTWVVAHFYKGGNTGKKEPLAIALSIGMALTSLLIAYAAVFYQAQDDDCIEHDRQGQHRC